MGDVEVGRTVSKTLTIPNTGELGGKMTFSSSDPQFVVPSGEVPVSAKGTYDLKVDFKSAKSGPASATIGIKSNDPADPIQSFKVVANGATAAAEDDVEVGKDGVPRHREDASLPPPEDSSGCAVVRTGRGTGRAGLSGLLCGCLGLAAFVRRRRR